MPVLAKKYLFSDMDNTLIGTDKKISGRNLEALGRFVGAGGFFSVATGRNVQITRPFLDILPVNGPAILYNGAAVYDFGRRQFLHKERLDPGLAQGLVRLAAEVYPGSCPEIFSEGPILLTHPRGGMDHYIINENQPYEYTGPGQSYEDILKVIVYGEHERLEQVRLEVARRYGAQGYHCTYSAPFYLEYLPAGASKGAALRWIEENLGCAVADVAAIGDYYNDVQMLKAASLGAAVGNAPEDVREYADVVVADCDHHALADLIDTYLLLETAE